MLNLNTRKQRNEYQNEIIRQMIILEKRGAKEIRSVLNKQFRETANLIRQGTFNVNAPVNMQGDRLYSIIYNHYRRVAVTFARRTDKELNKEKGVMIPFIKKKEDKRKYWLAIFLFIRKESVKTAEEMNGTTKSILQRIINKGFEAGKTNDQIAKDLIEAGQITNYRRALRASRTETHSMAVNSMHEMVVGSGVAQIKEWITARDERVRTSPFNHQAADGERVPINDHFLMTGEPMMFPGDPSGSPGNIINCRCVVSYYSSKKSNINYNRKQKLQAALRNTGRKIING